MKMLLALSTGLFDGEPVVDLIPVIRRAGFTRLELVDRGERRDGTRVLSDVLRRAQECGVGVPNWHLIQESPFGAPGHVRRDAVERTKESMEWGSKIRAKNHVLHWYHRYLDRRCDALWRAIVDEWAEYAGHLGVRLLLETVPDKPSNERYVPSAEIMEFACRYPGDVMGICVDVNHSNLQEALPDVVDTVRERLVSLHVSDNDGCAEKHWLPGQGVVDYPALFASLETVPHETLFVLEVGRWCARPHDPEAIARLHEFGRRLMDTGRPHPATPPLDAEAPRSAST
jgi:sugar phosphate isomerase/epimerase